MRPLFLLLLLLLSAPAWASASPYYPPFGIDLSAQDKTIRPQDDFFTYENGAWIARTPIPADRASVGTGSQAADRILARLHTLLEAQAATAPENPTRTDQKAGAMYAAFMDEHRIEAAGIAPIQAQLTAIRAANDPTALASLMGRSAYDFGGSVFSVNVDVDLKDYKHYAVYLTQSGLGLPDRDYYLKPDFAPQKTAYQAYAAKLLSLIAWPNPAASAAAIVDLETQIATVSWTKAEQRDPPKLYNPMTPAELQSFAPGFAWSAFLNASKLPNRPRIIIGEKTAFPKIAAIIGAAKPETVRAWLAFNVADTAAPYLPAAFEQAHFEFRDRILSGQAEEKPRWKRAIEAVSGGDCGAAPRDCFGTLNWAVGEMYVAHDFKPETKAKVRALVANLQAAFRLRLQKLDWMSPATKTEALKKLDTYNIKVGYPDHSRDYANLQITRTDLAGDVRRAAEADWDFTITRSTGPVDRTDWQMPPQTMDAYNGALRDIVFPAAILQPPEFDPAADDAANYGAIGAIIGHEMTHGFDDEGRTIDAAGNLRDWWTKSDADAFKTRAALLGAQFAAFEPLPGLHINPDLTMGENIADLGGLLITLDAYHISLAGKPAPVLNGFTGDQRLFMAYAQGWRGHAKEDAIRKQTVSDPHSYRKFRVLGPLPNVDAFYASYAVKPGDKMYLPPEKRARIW